MPDLAGEKIAFLSYCGPIDAAGVSKIAGMLNAAVNEQFDRVHLCFSSGGGYVGDGIYLYNHIRGLPIPITMHNTGTVASIATTLFSAAERRICSVHSIFMMHPVAVTGNGSMVSGLLLASLDAAQTDEARTEAILRERTDLPEDILSSRRTTEVWITPEKALTYGLVHEVAEFTLPPGNKIIQIG
jgi:ATP-dependent protease ClpP protease subunit